jgi:hypothetical protein
MAADPNWYQIVEHFSKKLDTEKDKLTSRDSSREEDLYAKGRISAYKELLSFKKTLETRPASSANLA